jgi:hypothetical protein
MITAIELPDGENDPRLMALVKAANGKTLLIFDPTDEETPVGLIRAQLQGAWGNISNGADSQVLQMPVLSPDAAGLIRKGSFTLAPEDLTKPVKLDLHIGSSNYAHTAGPLLLLRPRVLGSHVRNVTDVMQGKSRAYAIELGHTGRFQDSFDIAIPAGYVVDETPDPVDVNVDFASYKSSVSGKGNLLHYEREYVVKDVEIPAAKAGDFRKLQSAIMDDERSTAVLKKP